MGLIKNNILLRGVRGMLGETIVIRKTGSQLQMANRPDRQAKATPKQQAIQDKFRTAAKYAKQQMSDNAAKALYATGITESKKSARIVAVSDYLNPPKVHFIGTSGYMGDAGNTIVVNATDDFMVTRLEVTIKASDGTILETGLAVKDADINKVDSWFYVTKENNPSLPGTTILAVAYDRPGNTDTMEVTI